MIKFFLRSFLKTFFFIFFHLQYSNAVTFISTLHMFATKFSRQQKLMMMSWDDIKRDDSSKNYHSHDKKIYLMKKHIQKAHVSTTHINMGHKKKKRELWEVLWQEREGELRHSQCAHEVSFYCNENVRRKSKVFPLNNHRFVLLKL